MEKKERIEKIVVFTGAGIGVPMGLPTVTEIAKNIDCIGYEELGIPVTDEGIKEHERKQKAKTTMMELVKTYLGKQAYDIEKILSVLYEFNEFDFIDSICEYSGKKASGYNNDIIVKNTYKRMKDEAKDLIVRIKKELFTLLQEYHFRNMCNTYNNIFKNIYKMHGKDTGISYITTNYDLTLENYFMTLSKEKRGEEKGMIDKELIGLLPENPVDHFKSIYGGIIFSPEEFDTSKPYFEYIKLHGSLDWTKRGDECVRNFHATTPDNPDDMHIVYPGDKHIPDEEPFATLHYIATRRFLDADEIYVIGFAFRDRAINYLFRVALSYGKRIKVLDPNSVDQYPNDSKYPDLVREFRNQIRHYKEPLTPDKKPAFFS